MEISLDRVLGIIGAVGVPAGLGVGIAMDPKTLGELRFAQACLIISGVVVVVFASMWGVSADLARLTRLATVALLFSIAGIGVTEGVRWAQQRYETVHAETKGSGETTPTKPPDSTIVSSSPVAYDLKISQIARMASLKVDTRYALQYKNDLKLMLIFRVLDNTVDSLDDARLEKSAAFEITGEVITIDTRLSSEFFDRLEETRKLRPHEGNVGIDIALIPKVIRPEEIVTRRDITRLGGKQLTVRGESGSLTSPKP